MKKLKKEEIQQKAIVYLMFDVFIKILYLCQIVFLELVYTRAKFQERANQDHSMFEFLLLFTRFSISTG